MTLRIGMASFNRCEARVGDGCRCQAQSRVKRAGRRVCMRHARLYDEYATTFGEADARERLEVGRSAMTAADVSKVLTNHNFVEVVAPT